MFAAWRDALATFFTDFMEQYTRESASCKTGYEKFVVCMHIYFSVYDAQPEWYDYTREMFSTYSEKNTGSDVNNVFWKYYDREIPVPALKAVARGRGRRLYPSGREYLRGVSVPAQRLHRHDDL